MNISRKISNGPKSPGDPVDPIDPTDPVDPVDPSPADSPPTSA